MRNLFLLLSLLVALSPLLAQYAGNSRLSYANTSCTKLSSIDSPINMIPSAHKFITEALRPENKNTIAKFIHFVQSTSTINPGQNTIKMAFSIVDMYGTKYLGLEVISTPNSGSTKINKFLLTNDLQKLKAVIDPTINGNTSFNCGDLKTIFTDKNPTLDNIINNAFPSYAMSQRANNLLSGFGIDMANPDTKSCETVNYVETDRFYGQTTISTPADLLYCNPSKPPIVAIKYACQGNSIMMIQLVYIDPADNGMKSSPIAGYSFIPASTVNTFDVSGATRLEFESYVENTNMNSFFMKSYDAAGKLIRSEGCGNTNGTKQNVSVLATNFLGFTGIYQSGPSIQGFDIAMYKKY